MRRSARKAGFFELSVKYYGLVGLCLLMQACATPAGNLKELARDYGFHQSRVRAQGFDLLVFDNLGKTQSAQKSPQIDTNVLHVYLEGDGSPWRHGVVVMPDPTPVYPLMLKLMQYERNPAVYMGRPCYNGFSSEPECNSGLWTFGRFSRTVVNSMSSGIRAIAKRHNAGQIWLIGHSGGGALAMLLADQLPQVTRVVTLAGNLDTDAWTQHHGYTPLVGSINPAKAPALDADIWQWHLTGARDAVIPPKLVMPMIMAQPSASGFEFSSFDHGCCWERIWPEVLYALDKNEPKFMPAVQFKFRAEKRWPSDSQ